MKREDLYKRITDKIISNLESAGSWQKLWNAPKPISLNKHTYKGANFLMLANGKYKSQVWGTFNQVRKNGGNVLKGQKSELVVFWKMINYEKTDQSTGELTSKTKPLLKHYNVFNVEQCTFDEKGYDYIESLTKDCAIQDNNRDIEAETIILQMQNKPIIKDLPQDRAFYTPALDAITMPELKYFVSSDEYYSTLFHELTHSTGHKDRLNRDTLTKLAAFGSHECSKEELVAELGASYLTNIAGLQHNIENATAYIKGWSNKLKDNTSWILWAANKAQAAVDFILND